MRTFPASFNAILEQQFLGDSDSLVALIELTIPAPSPAMPDSTDTFYYVFWDQDVTFGGQVYTANAGTFDSVDETLANDDQSFVMILQNVNKFFSLKLNAYRKERLSFNGSDVTIRIVSLGELDDSTAQIETGAMKLSGADIDQHNASFAVSPPISIVRIGVPRLSLGGRRVEDRDIAGIEAWYGWPGSLPKRRLD